jgi:hypothetical protein
MDAGRELVDGLDDVPGVRPMPDQLRVGGADGLVHPAEQAHGVVGDERSPVLLRLLQATAIRVETFMRLGKHPVKLDHVDCVLQLEAAREHGKPLGNLVLRLRGRVGKTSHLRALQLARHRVELIQRVRLSRTDRLVSLVNRRPQGLVDSASLVSNREGALDDMAGPDHLRHHGVVDLAEHIVDLLVDPG